MELSTPEGKVCLLEYGMLHGQKAPLFVEKSLAMERNAPLLGWKVSFLEMEVPFIEEEVPFIEMEASISSSDGAGPGRQSENMKWNAPFPCATFPFLEMKDPFIEAELPFLEMEASFPEMERSISSFGGFHSQAEMAKAHFPLKNPGTAGKPPF
jgi:hypothetical protein